MNTPDESAATAALELRHRAQAAARQAPARAPEDFALMSAQDMQLALQELHVHQIELEMQNDELRRHKIELEMQNDELRCVQAALDSAKDDFFDFYDLAPVGYITLGSSGRILRANRTTATLLGINRKLLIGQAISRFVDPAHQDQLYLLRKKLRLTGDTQSCELCLRKADGTPFWVQLAAISAVSNEGTPVLQIVLTDATERRHAAQLLRAGDAFKQRILDSVKAEIAVIDVNGVIVMVNAAWRRFALENSDHPGEPAAGTGVGANYLAVCQPSDGPAQQEASQAGAGIRAVLAGQQASFVLEYPCHSSQQQRWFSLCVTPLSDIAFGGAVLVRTDITERKQSEALLQDSEFRWKFALEGAGDGLWDWNLIDGSVFYSTAWKRMLDFAEDELASGGDEWGPRLHPDDQAETLALVQAHLDRRTPIYVSEHRIRCKDGGYKWILARGMVVNRTADGKPLRMIGIHTDITERKRAEQALLSARFEADRANQAKSHFLTSMSHELRTPLNSILGYAQVMEHDASLAPAHQQHAGEILAAGYHLLQLIKDLLDLAKVEAGQIAISMEPVEVDAVVHDCLQQMAAKAEAHHITLGYQAQPGAAVLADRTRLRQVLLNLLSNAIKYNREGGSVQIEVQAQDGQRLRLVVTDTGIGIPAARRAELFQPFNRLDADGSTIEGTGIGLSISRRIAGLMGGSVDVCSTPGVGSSFWIELECAVLADVPTGSAPAPGDTAGLPADGSTAPADLDRTTRTVLCIDDDPSSLRLVVQMLGRHQRLNVLTTLSPVQGIALALAHRPALVLLDIIMPGMNGFEVLEAFKATPGLADMAVVAVSANAMTHDIELGLAVGFSDYLIKPLDLTRFNAVIDRLLGPMALT
ncbi:MAG: PAS domain S-box protein [Rhodoferax sp.]